MIRLCSRIFILGAMVSIFCFGLNVQESSAEPQIAVLSGSLHNGGTITIRGSDFGSKSSAAPLISSYNNSNTANNWSTGSIAGDWTSRGTVSLSTTILRNSLPQSSRTITYDNGGAYDSIRYLRMNTDNKVYVSFWMYRDNTTWNQVTGSGNNAKFLRIYQSSGYDGDSYYQLVCDANGDAAALRSSGDHLGGNSQWSIDYTSPLYNATRYNRSIFNASTNLNLPQLQNWEHYEYYMDYPSSQGGMDGINVVWKNGATVARSINLSVGGSSNDRRWVMIGQVSGAYSPSYNEYIDQVYIDNTLAHIYISDSANTSWPDNAFAHHSEIQVASEWSDKSITFTFNQGGFSSGDTVYLYIVDNNGSCNSQGHPINIGGGNQAATPITVRNFKNE